MLVSYSCQKDKLTPALSTTVSSTDYAPFSTVARIQSQVLGLYATIRSSTTFGGRYQVYNDVKADNWINSTANSVTAYQTWTETVSSTSSEVLGVWSQCYLSINDCNLFIDGMNAAGTAIVANTTTSAAYIAEAKFIRALNYYALLEMYCQPYISNSGSSAGVPIRLTGNSLPSDYSLAPSTVAKVYDQIISDLKAAQAALPVAYYTTGTTLDATSNVTRVSQNTATALLTRVYLSMGQYANVVTEANKIVGSTTAPFTAKTGVPYALQPTIATIYKTYTTTESILSMPFVNSTETPGSQSALAAYFSGGASAEFYLNTSSMVYTDAGWKSTDARRLLITSNTAKTKYYVGKYSTSSPYVDWAPVMRYSEVLLNLAEARSRVYGATDDQAVALLNAVRKRSDPTTTFTTATIDNILEERNIEFLGEGLRWNDLWRLGLTIPAKGSVTAVPPTASSYIWPMSGNEQIYNPLIGR